MQRIHPRVYLTFLVKASKFFCQLFLYSPVTLAPSCCLASPQRTTALAPDRMNIILAKEKNNESSFYVYDMKDLEESMAIWEEQMHGICPFYAVKCNPNPKLIKKLASLGAKFDCASPNEIDVVCSEDVAPSKILYANPCKRTQDIAYALQKGVTMTTFDSVCELEKIKSVAPDMGVVLRIYANDPNARCILSNKFGARETEWARLLQAAKRMNLRLEGVSFHVGSGASTPEAFSHAIKSARDLYDLALAYGYKLKMLDIGGGFSRETLHKIAPTIQTAIGTYFPPSLECDVIAEPGRFFAETCGTLYTRVIGVRDACDTDDLCCTITDGLYGSFNNVVYDHAKVPYPEVISLSSAEKQLQKTTIFGPTCDGYDTVATCMLPTVQLGDYIVFRNMGAYTIAGACDFNGIKFTAPTCYAI